MPLLRDSVWLSGVFWVGWGVSVVWLGFDFSVSLCVPDLGRASFDKAALCIKILR